jgi:hypothetical protein
MVGSVASSLRPDAGDLPDGKHVQYLKQHELQQVDR